MSELGLAGDTYPSRPGPRRHFRVPSRRSGGRDNSVVAWRGAGSDEVCRAGRGAANALVPDVARSRRPTPNRTQCSESCSRCPAWPGVSPTLSAQVGVTPLAPLTAPRLGCKNGVPWCGVLSRHLPSSRRADPGGAGPGKGQWASARPTQRAAWGSCGCGAGVRPRRGRGGIG